MALPESAHLRSHVKKPSCESSLVAMAKMFGLAVIPNSSFDSLKGVTKFGSWKSKKKRIVEGTPAYMHVELNSKLYRFVARSATLLKNQPFDSLILHPFNSL